MLGHNSASYGQKLTTPVLPLPPKGQKHRFPYFKFYPRDWLESTRELTLEQRGAYIDLICILMEMEGHLADNDKWISHQMHVNPRKWKAMKQGLIEHEKIAIQDGQITNDRCLKELSALMDQRRNMSDSAVKRERTKRETSVKHPGNIDEESKKTNEINEHDTTAVPLRARASDKDSDLEKEKEKKNKPASAQDPVRGLDEIDGLNGATVIMQMRIAKWMNPIMPKHQEARTWLTSTVSMFGSDVVRDAFSSVETKSASGDIVGSPLKLMTAICQQKSAALKASSVPKSRKKPDDMPDFIWERIQADEAAAKAGKT